MTGFRIRHRQPKTNKTQWKWLHTKFMDWFRDSPEKRSVKRVNYFELLVYRLRMPFIFRCVGFIALCSQPNSSLQPTILKHTILHSNITIVSYWSRLKSAWIFSGWAHSIAEQTSLGCRADPKWQKNNMFRKTRKSPCTTFSFLLFRVLSLFHLKSISKSMLHTNC